MQFPVLFPSPKDELLSTSYCRLQRSALTISFRDRVCAYTGFIGRFKRVFSTENLLYTHDAAEFTAYKHVVKTTGFCRARRRQRVAGQEIDKRGMGKKEKKNKPYATKIDFVSVVTKS